MATSGSKNFVFPVDSIIRKAIRRVGGEWSNAEEQGHARDSLNFIMLDLINKDAPLGSIKEFSVSVGTSAGQFSVENGTIGVLDMICRTSGITSVGTSSTDYDGPAQDLPMGRMSFLEYHQIVDKDKSGRPTQFTTEVSAQEIKIKVWPINDTTPRHLVYYAIVQPDVVMRSTEDLDLMQRYIPAVTEKLAYELGKDRRNMSSERLNMIKKDADDLFDRALTGDRERVTFRMVPSLRRR